MLTTEAIQNSATNPVVSNASSQPIIEEVIEPQFTKPAINSSGGYVPVSQRAATAKATPMIEELEEDERLPMQTEATTGATA